MRLSTFLRRVERLAYDLSWTWCPRRQAFFAALDPALWEASNHAPLELLRRAPRARLAACAADDHLVAELEALAPGRGSLTPVPKGRTPWFPSEHGQLSPRLRVAYFCSEYAIHESIQQYSGGLGVLAGDHLKSASDLGLPLVAVGLAYRHGYYVQEFARDGSTRVLYPEVAFTDLPLTDTGQDIEVPVGKEAVSARIWRMQVGRVPVFLLDADRPGAPKAHRELTMGLYKGNADLRLRQQLLLGIGGMLALDAVKQVPTVVHLNEGHAAFANVERLRRRVEAGRTLEQALADVRGTTVFTTHTPVPAGHDWYEPAALSRYLPAHRRALGLDREQLADLGRQRPGEKGSSLCMTVLGLRTARFVNAVSGLHGQVTRAMWRDIYGDGDAEATTDEVPIGHITNGIHVPTWLPAEAIDLYEKRLGRDWLQASTRGNPWKKAARIRDEELWALRTALRAKLVHFVRERVARQARRHGASPAEIARAYTIFDPSALTIGFARRFATYKRAPLVFRDPARLARLLGDPERPVQLVFAGKAHPDDEGGQNFATRIHAMARRKGLEGRVALIEEYDMNVGRTLTSGCDVWLNNPVRPHEASGTSGMKPPLCGGINASILDGWWPEGFDGTNGWSIGDEEEISDPKRRDARDARALYELLEDEIVPEFWDRDSEGLARAWIERMRRSLITVPGTFNTHRMVAEYTESSYLPAHAEARGQGRSARRARGRATSRS